MSFNFQPLEIPEVVVVRPTRHRDGRGFFEEIFRRESFSEAGVAPTFVQDNLTRSTRGVLRGLHYQLPPRAQGKLIRVVRGAIFDVAVDLRGDSPSYGRWVGRTLDEEAGELLWIPPGFAHGYCILSAEADVLYKVTAPYAPDLNRGIAWDDPEIGVDWPIDDPTLSDADRSQPGLADCDNPFRVDGS